MGVEDNRPITKLANTVMYVALTFYTAYFAVIYLKRLLTLTFLTLIAPLVALTYPIDKVKDSKAQAFDFWLKEYVINAMLPVIHYILYIVLIKSADSLPVDAPLYAICAMAFLVPAEKIVKQMFGINSQTAPTGSMTGAALAGSVGSKILDKFGGKGGNKGKSNNNIRNANTPSASISGSGLDALGEGIESGESKPKLNNEKIGNGASYANTGAQEYNDEPGYNPAVVDQYNNFDDEESTNGAQEYFNNHNEDIPQINDTINPDTNIPQASTEALDNLSSSLAEEKAQKKAEHKQHWKNAKGMIDRKLNLPPGKVGMELARRAGKRAIRLGSVATMGAIGLSAGMVGGNMSDMLKGVAGGAAFGTIAGKKMANGAENKIRAGMRDRDEIFHGQDEAELRDAARDFNLDYDARAHLQSKGFSTHEINNRMKEYEDYNRQGITDVKEMDRLHDIRKEMVESDKIDPELAKAKTLELAELSKNYQKSDFLDSSKTEHITTRMAGRFENVGLNKEKAQSAADKTVGYLSKLKGATK